MLEKTFKMSNSGSGGGGGGRPHPRTVRRGNTSGLIGLWNQKSTAAASSSSSPAAKAAQVGLSFNNSPNNYQLSNLMRRYYYLVLMIFLPKTCCTFRFFQSQDKGTLVVTEYSSGVDAESLAIRERANRRISVRDPPKLQTLEDFSAGLIAGKVIK